MGEAGVSVVADPRPDELPGHALIPEPSHSRFLSDKAASREIQRELAKVASRQLVWQPPGEPFDRPPDTLLRFLTRFDLSD